MLPQPMEGDEDSAGHCLAEAPRSHSVPWGASTGDAHGRAVPQPPSMLEALGAQAPHRSPAGKGEGASGKARRTKKASINYSSGELK